jgi:hypothetical protein
MNNGCFAAGSVQRALPVVKREYETWKWIKYPLELMCKSLNLARKTAGCADEEVVGIMVVLLLDLFSERCQWLKGDMRGGNGLNTLLN